MASDVDRGAPAVDSPVGEDEFAAPDDLKVTGAVESLRLLNLPDGGISGAQRKLRGEVLDVITSASDLSAAPATTLPYEAVARSTAPDVSSRLGSHVLPMPSVFSSHALFGVVLLVGPRTYSSDFYQPDVRWSYDKLVKAAITYWPSVRGTSPVLESDRSTQTGASSAG